MISISKKNALLSVYNKTGIVQFARALKKLDGTYTLRAELQKPFVMQKFQS